MQRAGQWFVAGLQISLVAGLAHRPLRGPALQPDHGLGLPVNIGSELLSTLVIMPAPAVGAVAEALGGGGLALSVAGWGLERLTELARVVSAWPQDLWLVASAPEAALTVSFLGLLLICIVRAAALAGPRFISGRGAVVEAAGLGRLGGAGGRR